MAGSGQTRAETDAGEGGEPGAPAVQGQVLRDRSQQVAGGVHEIPSLLTGTLTRSPIPPLNNHLTLLLNDIKTV